MTTRERIDVLRQSAVFGKIPAADLKLLAEMMREEQFDAGAIVCAAGEPAAEVFVVARGRLTVVVEGTAVRDLGSSDVVGEYGMVEPVRTATIRASDATTLLSLEHARFRHYLSQYPAALWALFELAVRRLIESERR